MIFVKIDGVDGGVKAKGHEKWILANTLAHSVSRQISTRTGGGQDREQTKPSLSEIVLTLSPGPHTPKLFAEATTGKGKKVQIHIVKTSGDQLQTFMEYELENCLVSSHGVESKTDDTQEQLSLNFTKINLKFTPWKDDHTPDSPITSGYDASQGAKV
jgi:type VI secretion system secreted protein Hcp